MIARLILTATIVCLSSPVFAGSYLVQFSGTVTEIDEVAPDSFWIGEQVAGGFVYDPDAPAALTITQRFATVDQGGHAPGGWSDAYSNGFPAHDPIMISQVFRGGGLFVATESGFAVRDEATDILWLGMSDGEGFQFAADGSSVFQAANSGRLANLIFRELAIPTSLSTLSGPTALGIELAFGTPQPEIVFDAEGDPSATLRSLTDPDDFPGLLAGSIVFATEPKDFWRPLSAGVTFEIDAYQVLAIPEPTTLLLTASLVLGTGRRHPR